MEADPLELDDEGLPLFRPDPAHAPEGVDVAVPCGWSRRPSSARTLAGQAYGKEVRR